MFSRDKTFLRYTTMSGPWKTAIVTGASRGIGVGTVKEFVHFDI
jgi:NADP-dependent 3-hydroxy acid dehydrogenase YdfG